MIITSRYWTLEYPPSPESSWVMEPTSMKQNLVLVLDYIKVMFSVLGHYLYTFSFSSELLAEMWRQLCGETHVSRDRGPSTNTWMNSEADALSQIASSEETTPSVHSLSAISKETSGRGSQLKYTMGFESYKFGE